MSDGRECVLVRFIAGPGWPRGVPVRDLPGWTAHAAFIDALVQREAICLGGPFADGTGAAIIFTETNAATVRQVLADDPFVVDGSFLIESVDEWKLFVDTTSRH